MSRIIPLAGGSSDEREVSLRSGKAVKVALERSGYRVVERDPADGIDAALADCRPSDIIFPVLHGQGGEDGSLQKQMEKSSLAFVGSDSRASALCFDKIRYAKLLTDHAYSIPSSQLVNHQTFMASPVRQTPFVLKPNGGGSSIDTFIVRDVQCFDAKVFETAFERHGKLVLQPLVPGDEITVGVLVDKALPVIEIIPPQGEEFDYANKYNGLTQELCPPHHIDRSVQLAAQKLAIALHQLTGCRDLSRSDMIVEPSGKIQVLETNTIPGLTDQSLVPKAAYVAGYDMSDLCRQLVEAARRRNSVKS